MKNNKINSLQFSSVLVAFIVTSFLGIGIYSVIKVSGVDAYLSVIFACIIGFLLLLVFIYIFNYEPDLPINKKINKLFGNIVGKIINIILISIVVLSSFILLYNLNNFIVSQFLSETPFFIIGILFSFVAFYINTKGIETMTRTSLILIIINIILLLTALIGLIPSLEISNIKPILANGISRPLTGVFYIITLNISPIFLLLIIPKNSLVDSKKSKKYIIIAYIFASMAIFFMILFIISCLGINLASYYQYPEYMVIKRVNLFNFLDRIENVIIIQWIFGLFITLSFFIYYITNTIKANTNNKLLIGSVSLVLLILSLKLFRNNTIFNNFNHNIVPFVRLVLIIIFIIIFITIIIKKKNNKINC